MTVTVNVAVADSLYVPFRGFDREAGAVGTLFVDGNATGDAGGGNIVIRVFMGFIEFGFHPIWVVTRMSALDDLATPEVVNVAIANAGNERLDADLQENVLTLAGFDLNVANFGHLGVPIEPDSSTTGTVLIATWSTNTDTKAYHFHAFGLLYDAEAMARGKQKGRSADPLLGGIR